MVASESNQKRRWGTVIARKDSNGNLTSYQARYVNPLNPSKKVSRNFAPEYQAEAYKWLDEEHYLVVLHNKGIRKWIHPSRRKNKSPTFAEYAKDYFDSYRKPDGSRLSGRSKRTNDGDLTKLNQTFGNIPLDAIDEQIVNAWYDETRENTTPSAFEHLCRTLKRVMRAAAEPQRDGSPALISASPCKFRIIHAISKRRDQPPITPAQVKALVREFPEYYRLAIWMSLLVGGLRIGEVCGLQIGDIDLDNLQLHVRRSVNRGPDDAGRFQLCDTKTKSSNRVVPIPSVLVPMIQDHIQRFCTDRQPGTMLFHSRLWDQWLLAPNTVQAQFRRAREKIGRTDITFHSLRATHATMFVLEGGTMREAMDELGHSNIGVAINSYQRVVKQHQRDTAELLAFSYMPSDNPTTLRTVIARKEREISELQKDVAKLRSLLHEHNEKTLTVGQQERNHQRAS